MIQTMMSYIQAPSKIESLAQIVEQQISVIEGLEKRIASLETWKMPSNLREEDFV